MGFTMKKFFIGLLVVVGLLGAAVFLFQEPLKDMAVERVTADMFIAADTDSFDPGIGIGAQFPAIDASLGGRRVTSVAEFAGPNGLIFVANRSIDW